jgi:hypothetical protein
MVGLLLHSTSAAANILANKLEQQQHKRGKGRGQRKTIDSNNTTTIGSGTQQQQSCTHCRQVWDLKASLLSEDQQRDREAVMVRAARNF